MAQTVWEAVLRKRILTLVHCMLGTDSLHFARLKRSIDGKLPGLQDGNDEREGRQEVTGSCGFLDYPVSDPRGQSGLQVCFQPPDVQKSCETSTKRKLNWLLPAWDGTVHENQFNGLTGYNGSVTADLIIPSFVLLPGFDWLLTAHLPHLPPSWLPLDQSVLPMPHSEDPSNQRQPCPGEPAS